MITALRPRRSPTAWSSGPSTEKVRAIRQLYLELLLSDHNSFCTPPCRDACPTHIKIPEFLDYIARTRLQDGVRKLREDLPFPAVLGRVCPRPCEGPCRRQLVERPHHHLPAAPLHGRPDAAGRADGRAAAAGEPKADTGKQHRHRRRRARPASPPPSTPGSRATTVKIFEALPKAGGMLRYGIPSYRLPRDLLDRGDQHPVAHGRRAAVRQPPRRRRASWRSSRPSTTPCSSPSGAFNSNEMRVPRRGRRRRRHRRRLPRRARS